MSEKPADKAAAEKMGGEKIIDADVEPLEQPRRGGARVVFYILGAILLSVAVAVGYQLAVTGRLDDLLAGRGITPQTASSSGQPQRSAPAVHAPAATPVSPAAVLSAASDPRLEELEQRMTALTASIERLQQLPAANAGDPQKLRELEQQTLSLRQAMDTATSQRAALQSQVAELQSRIAELSDARSSVLRDLVREPVLQLIAWHELREHARRGDKFVNEATQLGTYAESVGGNLKTAFTALQPFAEQTVPAAVTLAARYPALAEQQRAAPQGEPADAATKSWWQRGLDKLAGLVSIRRVGALDSTTVDGRLDIAQAALGSGDLHAAVAALDGVALVQPLADWREAAQARLKLDAALDAYGAALRGHLAVR